MFEWQDASIELKYSLELSTDKKKKINKTRMTGQILGLQHSDTFGMMT